MRRQAGAEHPPGETAGIDRRSFFARMSAFIAGLIALTMSIPLVGYIVSPALRRKEREWAEVGPAGDLAPLEPKELSYVVALQDGWLKTTAVKSVWAVLEPDESVTVFSPLCPHLGCGYHWEAADQTFQCPCHNSVFDRHGRVLAGPAPRPLDRLPAKVEDGRLWVIDKEFKAGVPQQIEL